MDHWTGISMGQLNTSGPIRGEGKTQKPTSGAGSWTVQVCEVKEITTVARSKPSDKLHEERGSDQKDIQPTNGERGKLEKRSQHRSRTKELAGQKKKRIRGNCECVLNSVTLEWPCSHEPGGKTNWFVTCCGSDKHLGYRRYTCGATTAQNNTARTVSEGEDYPVPSQRKIWIYSAGERPGGVRL